MGGCVRAQRAKQQERHAPQIVSPQSARGARAGGTAPIKKHLERAQLGAILQPWFRVPFYITCRDGYCGAVPTVPERARAPALRAATRARRPRRDLQQRACFHRTVGPKLCRLDHTQRPIQRPTDPIHRRRAGGRISGRISAAAGPARARTPPS